MTNPPDPAPIPVSSLGYTPSVIPEDTAWYHRSAWRVAAPYALVGLIGVALGFGVGDLSQRPAVSAAQHQVDLAQHESAVLTGKLARSQGDGTAAHASAAACKQAYQDATKAGKQLASSISSVGSAFANGGDLTSAFDLQTVMIKGASAYMADAQSLGC